MNFQICTGIQEQAGVTKHGNKIFFSIQAPENAECKLLLYPRENGTVLKIPMKAEDNRKTLYTVGVQGLDWEKHDYNFEVDAKEVTDPYARKITGREVWGDERRRPLVWRTEPFVPQREKQRKAWEEAQRKGVPSAKLRGKEEIKVKSSFYFTEFNWRKDKSPQVPKEDMVIYKLHVRGFSMGMRNNNVKRGTVGAIEHRLNDMKQLGVTTLLFMPLYEFEEFLALDDNKENSDVKAQFNYWGYTKGNYFAPKSSYLKENNPDELKRLIQKMHQKNMECILEFYFPQKINPHLILDVLHYWRREYHVDGFRIVGNASGAQLAAQDPRLGDCKLFFDGFQEELAQDPERYGPELFAYDVRFLYEVRKMLNHQGGNIYEFSCQMRRQQKRQGFVNFVAENNGFTLWDVFSYEYKHNELNEEGNRDGNLWNFSTNCGQEGFTRKRPILDLRKRQVKNALTVLFFAQGVPMLWMGDESGNSQNGNNNAYCQDNEIGWKDWKNNVISRQITEFARGLARLRREYSMLRSPNPYRLMDYKNLGSPDLSYHSDGGWKIDFDMNRSFIGMFYAGEYVHSKESIYIAYNFQYTTQKFALPENMEWKLLLDTSQEQSILEEPKMVGRVQEFRVREQSVCLLTGRSIRGKERGKGI